MRLMSFCLLLLSTDIFASSIKEFDETVIARGYRYHRGGFHPQNNEGNKPKISIDDRVGDSIHSSANHYPGVLEINSESPECISSNDEACRRAAPGIKLLHNLDNCGNNENCTKSSLTRKYYTHSSALMIQSWGGRIMGQGPSAIHLEPRGNHHGLRVDNGANIGDGILVETYKAGAGIKIRGFVGGSNQKICGYFHNDNPNDPACTGKPTLLYLSSGDVKVTDDVKLILNAGTGTNNWITTNKNDQNLEFYTGAKKRFILSYGGGTTVVGSFHATGNISYAGSLYNASDITLKENISKIDDATKKLSGINGYYYNFKGKSERQMGVIAQEVEKTFPEAVRLDKSKKYKMVDYTALISPMIEAIKAQERRIVKLENELRKLR